MDKTETAKAIETYVRLRNFAALIASSLAGLLWFNPGVMANLLIIAGITVLVAIYLSVYLKNQRF